jgi:hypothetical protein
MFKRIDNIGNVSCKDLTKLLWQVVIGGCDVAMVVMPHQNFTGLITHPTVVIGLRATDGILADNYCIKIWHFVKNYLPSRVTVIVVPASRIKRYATDPNSPPESLLIASILYPDLTKQNPVIDFVMLEHLAIGQTIKSALN